MNCVGSDIQNTDLQRDSDEVEGCSKCGCPCTARLDGIYFDTTKESGETPTTAFIDAILDLAQCDS